nr:erythrocyte membrane protein 1, PfEMP1, putative [Plasmodium sp. DRC-Itaito]
MTPKRTSKSKEDYEKATNAKDLLDQIGEEVYKNVHTTDTYYRKYLHGYLRNATFPTRETVERSEVSNPCDLKYEFHTNVTDGYSNEYPCEGKPEVRFSDEYGGQCTNKKIRGNKDNERGACAPLRRLFLCDHHLSHMKAENINSTDNLLLEVCLAAKHEGEILRGYHDKYKQKYADTKSGLCTILARSFADIGDIIRGKDLFIGYDEKDRKEKKQLQKSLKEIFEKIYVKLKEDMIREENKGVTVKDAETRYKNDKDENFFQLREDWWDANRHNVWKAITCNIGSGSNYFRNTCSNGLYGTNSNCRCTNHTDVPTYMDYVPQYLRWFEEWAEDFCTKRKHKIEKAIRECRGDNGRRKYCTLNGYNCIETVRIKRELVKGEDCNECSYSCFPFKKWIANQKEEFIKQKGKYTEEIREGENSKKERGKESINKLYIKEFYKEMKKAYPSVDKFLGLLNKEGICKDHPKVQEETASAVDFAENKIDETFSHTKYCEPCPWCGLRSKTAPWEPKEQKDCPKKPSKMFDNRDTTDIKKLSPEGRKEGILKKLQKFCNNEDKEETKLWTCHYEKENGSDDCVLQNSKMGTPEEEMMPYHTFFWSWVNEILEDSIKWKTELSRCINRKSPTCKKGCNEDCKCFAQWVKQKKEEFEKIKVHFRKQGDLVKDIGTDVDPDIILKSVLNVVFLEDMQNDHRDPQQIEKIKELMKKKEEQSTNDTNMETIIDVLFEVDLQGITNECKKCEEKPKQSAPESVARSDPFKPPNIIKDDTGKEEDEEEDDEDEVQEEEELPDGEAESSNTGETTGVVEVPLPPKEEDPKICDIVKGVLNEETLKAACPTKYGEKTRYLGWYCGGSTSDATKGSICVPPRRRKLYVGPLEQWATRDETANGGEAPAQSGNEVALEKLRNAFIESAAVETWFLWYNYNKIKTKEIEEKQSQKNHTLGLSLNGPVLEDEDNKTPQQKLEQNGEIPDDFLRQMFYTLGDYRDILVGFERDKDVETAIKRSFIPARSGTEEKEQVTKENEDIMGKIKQKIDKILETRDTPSRPSPVLKSADSADPNSVQKRESWWNSNVESIWNGMICALTYKESGDGTQIVKNEQVETNLLQNGKKPKDEYTYKQAKLEANQTQAYSQATSIHGDATHLTEFITRPTYFRWLEEWGDTFCKERGRRLEKIKDDCLDSGATTQKYSKDGESCDEILKKDPTQFSDLGPRCGIPCIFYKNWIQKKRTEFEKQQGIFEQQKNKCHNGSSEGGNYSCGTFSMCDTAAKFLHNLGPCSKTSDASGNGDGGDKLDFKNPSSTFVPATNCKPCSQFNPNCKNGYCSSDGHTHESCNGGTITASTFDSGTKLMENGDALELNTLDHIFDGDLKDLCNHNGDSNDRKKEQWKCRKLCGHIVCKLQNAAGTTPGQNEIITITALMQRWVENFLYDYKKIKKKLQACEKKENGYACIKKCAEQWKKEKQKEWENLRNRFIEQYTKENDEHYYVRSFLEHFLVQIGVANADDHLVKLSKFGDSCVCSAKANEEKKKGNDAIDCMLQNLQEKATSCKDQASEGKTESQCKKPLSSPTPDNDDEEPLEAPYEEGTSEEERKNMMPPFCNLEDKIDETPITCDEEKKKENVVEPEPEPAPSPLPTDIGTQEPAKPEQETRDDLLPPQQDATENQTPVKKPEPALPTQDKGRKTSSQRRRGPSQPKIPPPYISPLLEAMLYKTVAWSIGIGITGLSYWWLMKFLKKLEPNKKIRNIENIEL